MAAYLCSYYGYSTGRRRSQTGAIETEAEKVEKVSSQIGHIQYRNKIETLASDVGHHPAKESACLRL